MQTLIKNIGRIVSGDIEHPLVDGDSIAIDVGLIQAVGTGLDDDADTVIDARGTTVMPGLIDSHCHPVVGDFTPRQRTVDFMRIPSFSLGSRSASLAEMGADLRRAEDLGFDGAVSIDLLQTPPACACTRLEPSALESALAGVTRTIKLGTMVLVLPLRNHCISRGSGRRSTRCPGAARSSAPEWGGTSTSSR